MKKTIKTNSERNLLTAFALNLFFAIIELIGGIITNSVAILSDAIHDFGDSLSLGIALYLQKVSKKRGDDKYSYGYRRFSLLGSLFISIILIVGSIVMIKESTIRLFNPQDTNATGMLILSILGIIINGAAVIKLKKGNSHNENAVKLHMLEDVLGWAAVMIGSIIMYFTGFTQIDPILSIIIALWILFNVYKNIKNTLAIMLQQVPANLDISDLEKRLASISGVEYIHDLHIWSIDGIKNIASLHIMYNINNDIYSIKQMAREILAKEGIYHATIETETINDKRDRTNSDECR